MSKKVEIELGAWALPAKSSESLKLAYTKEELTALMIADREAIHRAISQVKMEPSCPLHLPVSPETLRKIVD